MASGGNKNVWCLKFHETRRPTNSKSVVGLIYLSPDFNKRIKQLEQAALRLKKQPNVPIERARAGFNER